MAQQVTVTETYWGVCWWKIVPYPCRKHRSVQKWAYEWSWLTETGFFLFSRMKGCEFGIKYSWTAASFNIVGSHSYFNIVRYYNTKRPEDGICPVGTGPSGIQDPNNR